MDSTCFVLLLWTRICTPALQKVMGGRFVFSVSTTTQQPADTHILNALHTCPKTNAPINGITLAYRKCPNWEMLRSEPIIILNIKTEHAVYMTCIKFRIVLCMST